MHKEFDGTFGNLRFEEVDEFVFESEADKQALAGMQLMRTEPWNQNMPIE